MFNLAKRAIVGAAALVSSVAGADMPGVGGALTEDGLNAAADVLVPYIFKNLKNLTIPEIDFKGGWFKNIIVQIPAPAANATKFSFLNATNGLELAAQHLQAKFDADFQFKEIITVDGKAAITVKEIGIDLEIDLSTQKGQGTSELAPKVAIPKVNINIDPANVDIKLTGGLVSRIAGILIPFIKGTLIPDLIKQLESTIQGQILTQINTDLYEFGTNVTIPFLAGVTADYGQENGGPTFTADKVFTMSLNGTFYDKAHAHTKAFAPAAITPGDLKGKGAQLYLTQYVLNTALDGGYTTGNTLDITYLLQKLLGLAVTTDELGVVIPQLLTKYGSGKNCSISAKFITAPSSSTMSPTGQGLDLSVALTIGVEGETALHVSLPHTVTHGIIYTKTGKIFGKLDKAQLGTIDPSDFSTTLGLTAAALQTEVQDLIDSEVAALNVLLAAGIVIPKIFGADVSDVELDFFDGYLSFGGTLHPGFWKRVASGLSALKEEIQLIRLHQAMPELAREWLEGPMVELRPKFLQWS